MKILESQSKKIKKYITFNIIIDWYEKNRDKIAKLLGVNPDKIVSTDVIINQTKSLISDVINPQSGGNLGRNTITGFLNFKPLNGFIIHDLLHNIYAPNIKNFDDKLSSYTYTESEIIEEIECLCVEQIYAKFFNIKNVKSDFINQNINLLAIYLCLAILKDNYKRINFFLKTGTAYIKVYNKLYKLKESDSYYNIFKAFKRVPKNIYTNKGGYIENIDDLKKTLIDLLEVEDCITETNGDRSLFPNGEYKGTYHNFSELSDDIQFEIIQEYCNYNNILFVVDEAIDVFKKYFPDFDYRIEFDDKKLFYIKKYDFYFFKADLYKIIDDFDQNIVEKLRYEFKRNNYLSIFEDKIDTMIEVLLNIEFEEGLYQVDRMSSDSLIEYCEKKRREVLIKEYDSNVVFYKSKPLKEIVELIFNRNSHALAILRRYFRYNNLIVNDTNLESEDRIIFSITKDNNFFYENGYASLGKNLFTNNAKNLLRILDELRGYLIKNFQSIKQNNNILSRKKYIKYLEFIDFLSTKEFVNNTIIKFFNLEYYFNIEFNGLVKKINLTPVVYGVSEFQNFLNSINEFKDLYDDKKVEYKLSETIYKEYTDFLKTDKLQKFINEFNKYNRVKKAISIIDYDSFFKELSSNGISNELIEKYLNLKSGEYKVEIDNKNIILLF